MKVLLVGGGGREHALAWGLSRSDSVEELFAAPGNAGIAQLAHCEPINATDARALGDYAQSHNIDLVVVGPEAPLVAGLADDLASRGLAVFGPSGAAARIEGSKAWAKDVMRAAGIPTAEARSFDALQPALAFLREFGAPCVVKADGLAAGKGVTVCETLEEAAEAVRACLEERAFGEAGATVVIEECLVGEEISVFCATDGTNVVPLGSAQDHKRLLDGDGGPNTGGMGAYSPVAHLDVIDRVVDETFEPLVAEMSRRGAAFRGVLFGGFMAGAGGPKVLEFNCRFGDPETQVLIPRLESDLGELLNACARGDVLGIKPQWSPQAAACVVLAGKGYPARSDKGTPVRGLEEAELMHDVIVFHAGTSFDGGRVVTAGGRIFGVTGLGKDLPAARSRAYEAAGVIDFDGMQMRGDIGARAIE